MLVFFLYEYLITLDREVGMIWKRGFSGATTLFLSNRYLMLLDIVFGLVEFGQFSDKVSARCALHEIAR